MRFSLRVLLAVVTLAGLFLAVVRVSDVPSACMFFLFVFWLLSPLLATFGTLYLRIHGWPRKQAAPGARPGVGLLRANR